VISWLLLKKNNNSANHTKPINSQWAKCRFMNVKASGYIFFHGALKDLKVKTCSWQSIGYLCSLFTNIVLTAVVI
jgi:hypothetical protein